MARPGRARLPLAMAVCALLALPAAAQQAPPSHPLLVLPMPSATHWTAPDKPPSGDSDATAGRGGEPLLDCGRDLPCRVRLRGVLGRNGGVAVEGTAFTW